MIFSGILRVLCVSAVNPEFSALGREVNVGRLFIIVIGTTGVPGLLAGMTTPLPFPAFVLDGLEFLGTFNLMLESLVLGGHILLKGLRPAELPLLVNDKLPLGL